jgi:hypothetical protein
MSTKQALPINISRRRWLGGAVALGASTVLTGPLQAKSASSTVFKMLPCWVTN